MSRANARKFLMMNIRMIRRELFDERLEFIGIDLLNYWIPRAKGILCGLSAAGAITEASFDRCNLILERYYQIADIEYSALRCEMRDAD